MTFEGIRPVLHVAFEEAPDESIRFGDLDHLVDRMLASGVDGIVVLGLASEAWTLTEDEREAVLGHVAEAVAQRVPLVVGIEGATAVAIARGRRAAARGAAGLMVLPPIRSQGDELLRHHLWRLADATGLPILVQDSPQLTGITLTLASLVALTTHPLVRAVKIEIAGAGAKISAAAAAGIEVVAGWGGLQYLESVRRGAVGCMPGCDLGPAFVAIARALRAGDAADADRLYRSILPLLSYEGQSLELLLLGAKRFLRRQGVIGSDRLRSPARSLDPEEEAMFDRLFAYLEGADIPGFARVAA
jgi:4-hydroxy-tetrahydrodipicolinate synthase